jgi:tetratricopeptide (TPR) repeat protein
MTEKTASTVTAESHYDRALEQMAFGDPIAAIASFRAALAADPGYLDAMHGLIRALQDAGSYDEALATAQQLISLAPEDVLAHTSLSILYQHMGRVPEAEAAALKAKVLGWKHQLNNSADEAI